VAAPQPPPDVDKFEEAIRAFRRRVPISDAVYAALTEAERAYAFKVAGIAQARQVQEVFDAIDRAIEHGTTLDDFKAEVGGTLAEAWGGEDAPRVERVFRTEVLRSYSEGREEIHSAPAVREAFPYTRFDAVGDARSDECDICEPLDGTILRADDPFWAAHQLPLHPNCFPGETPVLCPDGWRPIRDLGPGSEVIAHDGRTHRVLRRFARSFAGVLIAVRGPSGQIAYPTPNHPLASERGWISAERLNVQRDRLWVLQDSTPVPHYSVAGGDRGGLHAPIVRGLPGDAVPLSAVEFDGQHRRRDANVGVVDVDRQRDRVVNADRVKRCRHLRLVSAARYARLRQSAAYEFFMAALAAARRLIGGGYLSLPGRLVHAGVAPGVVFSIRPQSHASKAKHALDRDARASVEPGERHGGLSADVQADDFLLRQGQGLWHALSHRCTDSWGFNFQGDVFNLEIEGSPTYIAGGFLVHNCRCQKTPLDEDEASAAGVDTGPPKSEPPPPGFGRGEDPDPDMDAFDPGIAAVLRARLK
jgi:hypothetical protein